MTNRIKVSSSNLEGGISVIRIYLNNSLIVEEGVSKRNPVPYLKSLTRSKHFASIERKLLPYGLTLTDVGLSRNREAKQ